VAVKQPTVHPLSPVGALLRCKFYDKSVAKYQDNYHRTQSNGILYSVQWAGLSDFPVRGVALRHFSRQVALLFHWKFRRWMNVQSAGPLKHPVYRCNLPQNEIETISLFTHQTDLLLRTKTFLQLLQYAVLVSQKYRTSCAAQICKPYILFNLSLV
jgi:hypothetical protein